MGSQEPAGLVLLLVIAALPSGETLELLDDGATTLPPQQRAHPFDSAAKQQALNERARPTFYYQPLPAPTTTAATRLFRMPGALAALSWDSRSDGDEDSSGSSGSSEFFSGFSPSRGPFGSFRSATPSSLFKDSASGQRLASFSGDSVFKTARFKARPTRFRDDIVDESRFSSSSVFPDSAERAGERFEPSGSAEQPQALKLPAARDMARKVHMLPTRDLRKEMAVLRGRSGVGSPPAPPAPPARQHRSRQKRKRPLKNYPEQQYRQPYSDTRANNTKYKYYEDHDGNDTYRVHHYRHVVENHNYFNASDANGTGGSGGGGGGGSYSMTAAYDAMREAKKMSGYNVDYVQKDGQYVPVVHRQPEPSGSGTANLTDGNFPDGPHVKHHYYYNEYSHDHRNKSSGPVVRHHYHDKDYKVFYHDHRNKTSAGGPSRPKYSSGHMTYAEDTTEPSSQGGDPQSDAPPPAQGPGKKVKHYHHVKEYHYDEKGHLIDPAKYNYTNKYRDEPPHNASSSMESLQSDGGEEGDGDASQSSEAEDEPYQGVSYSDSSEGYTTTEGYRHDRPYSTTTSPSSMRGYYYSSHSTMRPSTPRYDPEGDGFSTAGPGAGPGPTISYGGHGSPSPTSYAGYRSPVSSARPYLRSRPLFEDGSSHSSPSPAPRPVGYQLHYRDYGDHSFLSKDVNFDDGFTFYKERRQSGPASYHHHPLDGYSSGSGSPASTFGGTYRSGSLPSNDTPDSDAPRYHAAGYRLATRDVDSATAVGGGKPLIGRPPPSALGPLAARAFPDHTRNLVSRGNIGYILVDPLGELPTIRIHASLVNSQQHAGAAYSLPRTAPPPPLPPPRTYYSGPPAPEAYPPTPPMILRRVDEAEQTTPEPPPPPQLVHNATAYSPTSPSPAPGSLQSEAEG